jgi:hypothetical protein
VRSNWATRPAHAAMSAFTVCTSISKSVSRLRRGGDFRRFVDFVAAIIQATLWPIHP